MVWLYCHKGNANKNLQERLEELLARDLKDRVAHFDPNAANRAAELSAQRKASGRLIDMRDTLIAGIALARRATLATRNSKRFGDLMTPVVDPWRKSRGRDPGA